jgi:transcriptional regulator with XRE-family HTH domain
MTQEQLAERAGLSPRALRKLESGASQVPRRDTLSLLAEALNLGEQERHQLQASVRRPEAATAPEQHTWLPTTERELEPESLLILIRQLARAIPLPYAEAMALLVYADLLVARGEWEEARTRQDAALAILLHLRRRLSAGGLERVRVG